MRGPHRTHHLSLGGLALVASSLVASGCGDEPAPEFVEVPGAVGRLKSSPAVRLARRAFDGAPPVIPHEPRSGSCLSCHDEKGLEVEGVGFAPAMPHALTDGLSAISRCVQCHVYRTTDAELVASDFLPHRAVEEPHRAYDGAPPVIPHRVFMHESCNSCHSGPAAREEIRTTHPERANCQQCHVPETVGGDFIR